MSASAWSPWSSHTAKRMVLPDLSSSYAETAFTIVSAYFILATISFTKSIAFTQTALLESNYCTSLRWCFLAMPSQQLLKHIIAKSLIERVKRNSYCFIHLPLHSLLYCYFTWLFLLRWWSTNLLTPRQVRLAVKHHFGRNGFTTMGRVGPSILLF